MPLRKPGKLPWETLSLEYQLEYGTDRLEMHHDALEAGTRVLLLDDVLATGGTSEACLDLVKQPAARSSPALRRRAVVPERTGEAGRLRRRVADPVLSRSHPERCLRVVRHADNHSTMYDALTARYTFACPRREQAHVALSSFRLLERLPGATHPAVYEVRFDCTCGDEHPGLVSHEDLDWAPLGGNAGAFVDLMTSRILDSAAELRETAAAHLQAGEWPWSFYCYPEGRPRPVFPSSFVAVAPGERCAGGSPSAAPCARRSP